MAVAGFIIVLLLGSILVPLGTQVEQRQLQDTQKYLEDIKEALIGFAVANGRLPCPASAASNGAEAFAAGGSAANGNCSNFFNGFAPATALGISTVDNQGFAVDPWGNRMRYAVTSANANAFTTTNGMSSVGLGTLAPNLLVCSTATGISATACAAGSSLTSLPGVIAVIYSAGRNGATGGTGLDEAANPNPNSANNDRVFVFHTPTPATAANGEFDDIMTWLSPNILYNRMVAAGELP